MTDQFSDPPGKKSEWMATAIREQMAPLVEAWDARSEDMLAVLREAGDTRVQVRAAARTIRVAAWLGVLAALVAGVTIWLALDAERRESRLDRERARVERDEAVRQVIEAGREDRRALEQLVRERICPLPPPCKSGQRR